jgi:thiol-disulfide isomerase/thioredoxin
MRINRIAFTIVLTIAGCAASSAQNALPVTRIGIGDPVPDFPLMNLVNYSKSEARISDFKGKWLILDYWFTGCGPCIASWPKLMQLQKKYGDKIQIMSVNHMQTREVVEPFITKRNKGSQEPYLIPSVTGDTILYKILPPSGYPTIVWIDPDGKYRAITRGEDLSEASIEKVLNKQDIKSLAVNTSLVNPKTPLFLAGNGGSGEQMRWYSTVSGYSEKLIKNYVVMSADSSGYVMALMNKTLFDLVMYAYCDGPYPELAGLIGDYTRLPRTRIELRVKNPGRLRPLYTYQLISYELRTLEQLKKIMRGDLQKYFDLEFKWEKVKKQCLVLTARDTTLLSDNKLKGKPSYNFKKEDDTFYIQDVPVSNLFSFLLEHTGGYYKSDSYPLVDETGFKGGMDLIFEGVTGEDYRKFMADYQKLDAALAKYKMHFRVEEREVDVLVVTDAPTSGY